MPQAKGPRLTSRDQDMWDDYVLRNMTQTKIAEKYGLTQTSVSQRLRALRATLGDEQRDDVVARRLAQLNAVLENLVAAARTGDKDAVASLIKVMDREARYLGLDAPAKQEISGQLATYRIEGVDLDALR